MKFALEMLFSCFIQNQVPKLTYVSNQKNVNIIKRCPSLQKHIKSKTKTKTKTVVYTCHNGFDWKEDRMMGSTTPIIVCMHMDSRSEFMQTFTDECFKRGNRSVVCNAIAPVLSYIETMYPRAPKYLVGYSGVINYIVRYPRRFLATVCVCDSEFEESCIFNVSSPLLCINNKDDLPALHNPNIINVMLKSWNASVIFEYFAATTI